MSKPPIDLHAVAIAWHPRVEGSAQEAQAVAAYLAERGLQTAYGSLTEPAFQRRILDREFELVIAFGGDGTMLRAGHLCGPSGIPLLGINMGHFGFLTEIRQEDWRKPLGRLFSGEYRLEQRMMLCAEQWRAETRLGSWDVLNEVVVSRGQMVRPVHLTAHVDGRFLATYVADALIAATPTGSTAYSLAAGGPILPPELRNILLVAVAPHLSIDRAIVLAEGSSVSITVTTDHHAVLSVDGQPPVDMETGDRVEAFASEHTMQFVRFQDPGYFYRNLTPHMNQNPSTGNMR